MLEQVALWQALVRLVHSSPQAAAALSSERGVPVALAGPALAGLQLPQVRRLIEENPRARLRIWDREEPGKEGPTRRLFIQLRVENSRQLWGVSAAWGPWTPPEPSRTGTE